MMAESVNANELNKTLTKGHFSDKLQSKDRTGNNTVDIMLKERL